MHIIPARAIKRVASFEGAGRQKQHQGVLAAAATGLGDFIVQQGGDIDRVFGSARVDPKLLESPTHSLSLSHYCQILEHAARQSGCDNFGLYYGRQFRPQSLGLIGYVGLSSPTLEDALRNVSEFFIYHQHNTLTRLRDKGDHYQFDYKIQHGGILQRRQDAELTLGMILNLIRHVLGKTWAPKQVHFEHTRPEQWQDHSKIFDAPVYFDQPFNSLFFSKQQLKVAMPDRDDQLFSVVLDAMQRLNLHDHAGKDTISDLKSVVRDAFAQGEPKLEHISAEMQMPLSYLQRELKRNGYSYPSFVDELRCELAVSYLHQHHLSISELAFQLGYSETSAFSRAFKRWFNCSPRQWRHQMGVSGANSR